MKIKNTCKASMYINLCIIIYLTGEKQLQVQLSLVRNKL